MVRKHESGKDRDTESGLDYFGARYYASTTGRWMSPDWSESPAPVPYANLQNPQSLNLYGYVSNNPLTRADQDGHLWRELWNWLRTGCNCWTKDLPTAQRTANQNWDKYMAHWGQQRSALPDPHYHVTIGIVYPVIPLGTIEELSTITMGGASEVGTAEATFPTNESQIRHIFRDAEGHVADTPGNRSILQGVANDPAAKLGADKYGNEWSAKMLPDGRQAWTQTRGDTIVNAGVNETPRTFNPQTGLKAQ